jgi:hypothetical protein
MEIDTHPVASPAAKSERNEQTDNNEARSLLFQGIRYYLISSETLEVNIIKNSNRYECIIIISSIIVIINLFNLLSR